LWSILVTKIIYCYSKDIQVHPVTDDILHIDSFKSLVIKKSLLKFLLKSLVTQKELWLVEIYV
jgi:hypothetical protein